MTGSLLLRGMISGVLAGIIAFLFAYVFGEPQVDLAIAFEDQMLAADAASTAAESGPEEPPLVTRQTQATIGLATGLLIYGAALGGMFSLVFAFAYGRLGRLGARGTSALLALAGFLAMGLVPLLKYPANPPAVGFDDTIAARTTLYFVLLAVSILIAILSVLVAKKLWAQRGAWTAGTVAAAVFVGLQALAFTALPTISEMPDGFDPLVIWNFRIATLGIHLILWTVIGLGFGAWAERLLEGPRASRLSAA
jgi:hypothetical protein